MTELEPFYHPDLRPGHFLICAAGLMPKFFDTRIPENVVAVAAKYGIPAEELDWHVEAEHGWEPHDAGHPDAVEVAARCHLIYGRSCR